jgi:hypothetical protein
MSVKSESNSTMKPERFTMEDVALSVITIVGLISGGFGIHRFLVRGNIRLGDALDCLLWLALIGLLLLPTDYAFHHSRPGFLVLMIAAGVMVFSYPAFAVAFGVVSASIGVSGLISNLRSKG